MSILVRLRPLLIALAAAAVLVGGGILGQQQSPADAEPATVIEPIGTSILLCPEPGAGDDLGVRVTAAVVPGQPGQQEGEGRAGIETLPGPNAARSSISGPGGQVEVESFGVGRVPPIRAFGVGSLAPGLVADQWGRDPRGTGRGMASTACAPAASEFWFVGGGAIAGRRTRVVLVNPDDTAAVVDVLIHGPDGLLDAPGGRGLVIPARERLVVRLDVLAPGVRSTAVHVIARSGRVGAAVDDEQMSGLDAVGTDWIPQAAQPATKVYVPGVLPGPGARVLSIVAPGDADAVVQVRIMSANGTYAPADRGRIDVPAGTVVAIDMAPATQEAASTLELTSDVPIVAGIRQFFGGRAEQDETSFSAGSQPFTGPAAVSGLPVRRATDVRLMVAAPEGDVVVDVTLLPYRGGKGAGRATEPTAPRQIKVGAGKVKFIRLEPPSGASWYTAIVTPASGSGPVLVAHRLREVSRFGDLVTGYPWTPLRTQVVVPVAQQNADVTLR